MTKIKWHRHYWCPWGYAIGFNDVAFVTVGGRTFEIRKFFHASGKRVHDDLTPRVKFYVPHRVFDENGGVLRFPLLGSLLKFLHTHVKKQKKQVKS